MSDQLPKKNDLNSVIPSAKRESSSFSLKKADELKNKKKTKFLLGFISLVILIIGGVVALYMTKMNQDLRQQASDDDYGRDGCEANYHRVNGKCVLENCQDNDGDGIIVCGVGAGTCDTDSLGGDWCDNPNTTKIEGCAETGQIRCKCGPGDDSGYWVIGVAPSCNALCEDANVICTDCPPEPTNPPRPPRPTEPPRPTLPPTITPTVTPTPTLPPNVTPTVTPTPTLPPNVTPTVTPAVTIIPNCGYGPCSEGSCSNGLTCVVANDGESYCSQPEYENACFNSPGVDSCCTEPTAEPTVEPTQTSGGGSSSTSYSESNSSATVNINNENNTTVVGGTTSTSGTTASAGETEPSSRYDEPVEPTLPPELPKSGPEDWIQYLQIGLGTLGIGALLLLFL